MGRSRIRGRLVVATAVVGVLAGGVFGPAGQASNESCTYDSAAKTVTATLAPGSEATLRVVDGELWFGSAPSACGAATTTNTDTIFVTASAGSDETLVLDHRGGPFGPGATPEFNIPEIEIFANLGDTTDRVLIHGTDGDDYMASGTNGLALNADGDVDVVVSPSVFLIEVHLYDGADYFNGRGDSGAGLAFQGKITMYGGPGDDPFLRGSVKDDVIYGGPGNDIIKGEAGDDLLDGGEGDDEIAAGDGADILIGGPGADNLIGSAGDDVIYANDGAEDVQISGGAGTDTAYYDVAIDPRPNAVEILIPSGPPPLSITTTSLPGGTVGQAYSQQVTATGGSTPYSWSLASGSLPPGLTLSPSGTPSATVSGTPTTAGTYTFTVQVTDAAAQSATRALSITIAPAPPPPTLTITTTSLPNGTVGQPYSQEVTATGGTTPYSWSLASGSLPPILNLSPTGTPSATISGTPTTPGTYTFTVQVTDAASQSATRALSITIAPEPPPPSGAPLFGSAGASAQALGTSVNVPYPSGIAPDDMLLLLVLTRDSNDILTPAGFNQGDARSQNSTLRAEWFWRRATGSETGTLSVSKASGSALLMARMYRFSGVVTSGTPFESAAQTGLGANATMSPAAITTQGLNRRAIVLVAEGNNLALGDFTGGTATVPEEIEEATTTLGTRGALGVNGVARPSAGLFTFGTYMLSATAGHIEFTFALIPSG